MEQSQLTELIWCREYLEKQGFSLFDGEWSQSVKWAPYKIKMRMVRENGIVFTEMSCSKLDQLPLSMINKTHFKGFIRTIKSLNTLYGMSLTDYVTTKEKINC